MLPALRKAKNKSQEIACLSNLKQIGVAVASYATDSNGHAPPQTLRDRCPDKKSLKKQIPINYGLLHRVGTLEVGHGFTRASACSLGRHATVSRSRILSLTGWQAGSGLRTNGRVLRRRRSRGQASHGRRASSAGSDTTSEHGRHVGSTGEMKIQLITAVAALWSCREKRPDPFDLCAGTVRNA